MGKDVMAEYVISSPEEAAESAQKLILSELRSYFFVGGMPECVKIYQESGSMLETFKVQSEIIDSYRDDFAKYLTRIDPACLDAVFLNVAKSVGEQLKYTRLSDAGSSQTNRKAFELFYWSRDARGSSAEIDFLAVKNGEIYPLEVKSGSGGSLRSLHLMLKNYPHCPAGLVLYSGVYRNLPEQKLVFMPLYGVATIGDSAFID